MPNLSQSKSSPVGHLGKDPSLPVQNAGKPVEEIHHSQAFLRLQNRFFTVQKHPGKSPEYFTLFVLFFTGQKGEFVVQGNQGMRLHVDGVP